MPFLLLILPILAHILLAAHLLFHGLGLFVSVLPLLAVPLLFIPKRWMVFSSSGALNGCAQRGNLFFSAWHGESPGCGQAPLLPAADSFHG